MPSKLTIDVPLNRVEGDLEIHAEIEDGVVTEAWSSGTMYRGIETILPGRAALDGLVITPRICGICSTSHLKAAVRALDMVGGAAPPPDATRVRNLALMTEHVQSDLRHAFLMFATDFVNPAYRDQPLFDEALRRYEPFKGRTVVEAIQQTRSLVEIISILGGQWPHASFMVPGGIASVPSAGDLLQCRLLLQGWRRWYEQRVLGCPLEQWKEVRSAADLERWLEASEAHRESELGFFVRFARALGLDRPGRGAGAFVSYGAFDLPDGTQVRGNGGRLIPAGFVDASGARAFDQLQVAEHVARSRYLDYEGGRHPFDGETRPSAPDAAGHKYSWAKAPRYDGQPAETGPLAEMIVARHPLFADLIEKTGATVFLRALARLVRTAELIPAMEVWLNEIAGDGSFYTSPGEIVDGTGFGLTEAPRGALGHWVRIRDGVIEHYQIVTPTAWNASPRDSAGRRGPVEEALLGVTVKDPENPVELGHLVRSFDACLVCTVHAVRRGRVLGRARLA